MGFLYDGYHKIFMLNVIYMFTFFVLGGLVRKEQYELKAFRSYASVKLYARTFVCSYSRMMACTNLASSGNSFMSLDYNLVFYIFACQSLLCSYYMLIKVAIDLPIFSFNFKNI